VRTGAFRRAETIDEGSAEPHSHACTPDQVNIILEQAKEI